MMEPATPDPKPKRGHAVLAVSLVALALGLVVVVLTTMKDGGIYSKSVDELLTNAATLRGRPVRADGLLVHGTLERRESPCEYRFRIGKNGQEMSVKYPQCVVPDTFRDVPGMDVGVTVEGKLLADNSFEATKVLAKCPSKYEMKDRAGKGEAVPHGPTTTPGI